ncbi:stage II sporulation protein R [Candidatus Epulonipiscioides gigas]|nr:stage II sporulation protein R [Epulopiscium sp. SCG-C07WGA-EpuloA2]
MRIDRFLAIVSLSVVLCLLFALFWLNIKAFAKHTNLLLKEEVIRFHILANSDTTEDQLIKEHVRDAVIGHMEPILSKASSVEESRELLNENMNLMKEISEDVIKLWGKDYAINIELADTPFPTKKYDNVVFPTGIYEACRILIGEANGQNWWCVMYPPLCYLDVATGVVPLKENELKENLTDEQYEIIAFQQEKPYKIGFKLLEWFEGMLE